MSVVWVILVAYVLMEVVLKGAITRALVTIALTGFSRLESFSVGAIRRLRPPRFAVLGECYRCGECCRLIVAGLPTPPWFRLTVLKSVFVLYHRLMHNFTLCQRGPNGTMIFTCGYVRPDGRCGIYRRRPLLCRDYPVLSFFEVPRILPGCSYKIAPRVVAKMRQRQSLPIVNPGVTVHHPTRDKRGAVSVAEDYEMFDDSAAACHYPGGEGKVT